MQWQLSKGQHSLWDTHPPSQTPGHLHPSLRNSLLDFLLSEPVAPPRSLRTGTELAWAQTRL